MSLFVYLLQKYPDMFRAILIDDEIAALKILRWEIEQHCTDIHIIGQFTDPIKGKAAIETQGPDLLFLDIEMPKLNGLDLVHQLSHLDLEVIFITAYDRYAVEAFRINAIDYLLKPFETSFLLEAVERVKKRLNTEKNSPISGDLIQRLRASFNKIALPTIEGVEFVNPEQIIYCKSDGSYTEVILQAKRAIITRSLGDMEEQLKEKSFLRIHKSYLVNISHIVKYIRRDGGYLIMSNGDKVAVSRRKKEVLLKLF